MAALGYRSSSLRSIRLLQPMAHVVFRQFARSTANEACQFLISPFCFDLVDVGVLFGMFALFFRRFFRSVSVLPMFERSVVCLLCSVGFSFFVCRMGIELLCGFVVHLVDGSL